MVFRDSIDFAAVILFQQLLLRATSINFCNSLNTPYRATNIVGIRAGSPIVHIVGAIVIFSGWIGLVKMIEKIAPVVSASKKPENSDCFPEIGIAFRVNM